MPANVIDTLQLDIIVNTKNSGQSVRTLTNNLEKLYKFLDGIQNKDFNEVSKSVTKLTNTLKPLFSFLSESNIAGAGRAISSLNSFLKNLDKNIDSIDSDKLAKKFSEMATAIDPFLSKINSAQESLVALNGVMGGAKTLTKTTTSKANTNILGGNLGRTLNFGSIVAKLYFLRNITKQLGQDLAKVVQYGIDYEETLNLWQTAMRGNISQARVFTSEMTKAYGISSATLMNYQSTFKNMLAALGNISETTAYGLSEALTQMALDFSSLYNVSVESAMTKFQAVLSGQVRPIRTAGYDITEQTLFQLYQQLGGTKTVRQLNQTEKQLLRILAVYKQMERSGATGDLAKTITSSANQIRIMQEQSKEFATWVGVAFNTILEKSGILVEINAWLYAGVALAKQFAIEMGYAEKDYSIDMDFENIENANKEADELQGKLLGFDKFQVLQSAGTEDAGVEEVLLRSLEAYQGLLDSAGNPAFERSLEILKMIGLELDENGNIVGGFDKVKERVTEIAKGLGGMLTFIGIMTKPWLVLVGAIEYAYWTNQDFSASVDRVFSLISSTGLSVMGAFVDLFTELAPILLVVVEITANTIDLLNELGLLEPAILLVVSALLAWKAVKITTEIIKIYQAISPLLPQLTSLIAKFDLAKAAAAGMATLGFLVALDAGQKLFSSWDDMSGLERAIEIFKLLAGAAMVAAVAVGVFHTSWSVGVAAGAITAGVASLVGYMQSVKSQADSIEFHSRGGRATKGSLFIAGEAGPELVTKTSGGNSTIMNMSQLEEAVRLGFIGGIKSSEFRSFADETTELLNGIYFAISPLIFGVSKLRKVLGFANGGFAYKGSLFYAGEAGPEFVTQTSGGGSTIMNMRQLEDAVARGFIRGFAATDNGYEDNDTTEVYVDGQRLFDIMRGTAKRNGYDFVRV